jgi:NAD(P)-dependent dehydrogenase (short-subunit alcohol dehydrogenase family)
MGRLEGKVAIITGAASGIGAAMVGLFAAEGARVLGVDRSQRRLDITRDALGLDEDRVAFFRADVASEPEIEAFVSDALQRFGRLDILAANAGVGGWPSPIAGLDPIQFMETLRINLLGPALLMKHGSPALTAQKSGSIIVTASIAGQRANSGPVD